MHGGHLLPHVLRPVKVLFNGESGELVENGSEYYADLARHGRVVDMEKNRNKTGECPQGSGGQKTDEDQALAVPEYRGAMTFCVEREGRRRGV